MNQTKKCTRCKEEKPINEFNKKKQGKYGVTSRCKKCLSIIAKELCRQRKITPSYKFMAINKGQLPTDYSRIFFDKQEALNWYEKNRKGFEEKCNRKLYFTELITQKQL